MMKSRPPLSFLFYDSQIDRFEISKSTRQILKLVAAFTNKSNFSKATRVFKGHYSDPILYNNLVLVESRLPLILQHFGFRNLKQSCSRMNLSTISNNNPLRIHNAVKDFFYKNAFKRLAYHLFVGMTSTEVWHGQPTTTGLSIILERAGKFSEVHIYNLSLLEEFLFRKARIKGNGEFVEIFHV
ncbi:HpaII family restriction endonuclease [Mucilaginibacter ginkgonis]|uniref:HpaII family restriction endonuclease n=1 Tax=Mucilaginibacter ginkgonis TaxID=2682091 RepID=A0A6I4I3R4_9SPHI|nr:HpaII family restriction endonuclease [Mucilaginibacter ginkgonis]QQL49128.1 HpaII family restriction endonuclease [Mucilaginibacter ginkgonis]